MKCLKREEVQAYLDGQMDEQCLSEIKKHLAECPRCRQGLEAARSIVRWARQALASLEPDMVPDWQPGTWKKMPRRSGNPWRFLWKPVAVPAGLLALVLAAWAALLAVYIARRPEPARPFPAEEPAWPRSMLTVVAGGISRQFPIDIDLSQYKAVKDPKIFVFKEEKNEIDSM